MVVTVNYPMDASRYFQAFDIGSKAGGEIIAKSRLLRFVKQKTVIKILKGVLRNLHAGHRPPIVPLADSQSKSCAVPSRTLARPRARGSFCRSVISNRSNRSRKSSQIDRKSTRLNSSH